MSICSYCYKGNISPKHDVGHWWNNPEDSVYVCSDECYTELEKLVDNRTWMDHKPEAIFGKKDKTFGSGNVMRRAKESKLKAMTDKQFTSN